MPSNDGFDKLVSNIYDAALDESLWPTILDAAAAHFHASKATVYTPERLPHDGGFFFSHDIPADCIERYAARYQHIDPWVHGHHSRFADQSGGFLGDMFVATSELVKSEFYADHLRPLDIHQMCTAVTRSTPHSGDYISFAMFRGRRAADFSEQERRLSERIAPHIQRAFLISSRLRPLQQPFPSVPEEMLSVSRTPIVLVDATANIVQATVAAARLLDGGVWLQNRLGRLRAATDNAWLTKTIFQIATSGLNGPYSRILSLIGANTAKPIHVLVARAGAQHPGKAYVVIGAAANQSAELAQRLFEVYGLTRAEARFCERLGEGRTIAEISELLSVQKSTLRSQLKSIFDKTGMTRQSDLARTMLDLASL